MPKKMRTTRNLLLMATLLGSALFARAADKEMSVMTMIFDFEPWQLDIDIDLTKQLYRSCKGDFVWVEKK